MKQTTSPRPAARRRLPGTCGRPASTPGSNGSRRWSSRLPAASAERERTVAGALDSLTAQLNEFTPALAEELRESAASATAAGMNRPRRDLSLAEPLHAALERLGQLDVPTELAERLHVDVARCVPRSTGEAAASAPTTCNRWSTRSPSWASATRRRSRRRWRPSPDPWPRGAWPRRRTTRPSCRASATPGASRGRRGAAGRGHRGAPVPSGTGRGAVGRPDHRHGRAHR